MPPPAYHAYDIDRLPILKLEHELLYGSRVNPGCGLVEDLYGNGALGLKVFTPQKYFPDASQDSPDLGNTSYDLATVASSLQIF